MFSDSHTEQLSLLGANLNSLVLDYCARQKVGGTHLTYSYLKQLPILPPATWSLQCGWTVESNADWLLPRVLELTYTAWDLEPFAKDCGYEGPPFRWDPARRALLRAELDAAFFHLYGIARDDVDYILETFPIVKRSDEKVHGEYRTKRLILERYDAMAQAIATGIPYQSVLDPPPADPRVAHPPKAANPEAKILPLRRPTRVEPAEDEKYRTCVPLIALKAAAGPFGASQEPAADGWVRLDTHRALAPGMFVAEVRGRSMEPRIPDGAFCLFGPPPSGTPEGHIVLVQLQDLQDPETGAQYTVKRFEIEVEKGRGRKKGHRFVKLVPLNREIEAIQIPLDDADEAKDVKVIGELLEVLRQNVDRGE